MATSSKTKKFLSTTAIAAASLMAMTSVAKADDHAWVLDNAGGAFSTDISMPATTTITQTSDRAIGVGNLDIAAHQSVNIIQNNSGSLFVAKDNRNDPTLILGKLKANGGVMILDENGIMFGQGSTIDVGTLVASTGGVSDSAIMRGDSVAELTNFGDASIVNNGDISIGEGGLAALVAPQVINNGTITAKVGKVALASGGERATVDLYGDGLIELTVNENGQSKAMIENAGKIEGAKVVMTAAAAKDVVDTVINVSGVVKATSASVQGGKIVLNGGKSGVVKVTGKLDASGENGGTIKVTGRNVLVNSLAELLADGGNNGNGGDIRVIGENAAIVQGRFSARGGAFGGNGGFVEVSGLNYLNFAIGNVDTTAANGVTGTLLIDPLDITIVGGNGDGDDIDGGNANNLGSGGTISFADINLEPFKITEQEIESQSATTNIVIQAQRNITTSLGTSADGVVTLAANRNLTIETQNNAGNSGTLDLTNLGFQVQGTGSMNIKAATGTVGTGDVRVGKLLSGNGNIAVTTDTGQIYLEKGAINVSGTGYVAFSASDRIFIDNDITTNSGNILMSADRFTIDDTDAGSDNLDQLKVINGIGGITINANTVTLGETGGDPGAGEVLLSAANGIVGFERKTAGTFGLGGAAGDTMLSDGELASITARELFIGSSTEINNLTTAIYVDSIDITGGILGKVTLSAYLNQTDGVTLNLLGLGAVDNNNVTFMGYNKFNGLVVNANDHIVTYGLPTTTIESTQNVVFNADANAQGVGGLLMSYNSKVDTNGKNFTFNGHQVITGNNAKIDAEGGNILLNNDDVFHAFSADALVTSGSGTITLNQWDKAFVDGGTTGFGAIGSINNAVQALNNTGNGLNTVHVGAGTYDENVIVNQKNILIRSMDGRDTTIVNGSGAYAGQGTFEIAGGINNTQIGETAHGFTINGFDGPTPGIERAAVYYTGAHTTSKLQGNKIVANGDEAILTEYGQANSGITIDNNIITGNTFTGADNAWGTGDQFVNPNVPRQLVALNLGNSNLTFSNNAVTGNAGDRQLVAIESAGANVFGNNFDGLSHAAALRVRGSDVNVYNNDIDGNGRGIGILAEKVKNLRIGGPLVADGNDVDFTGGDAIAVIDGNLNLGTTNITNNRIGQLGGANSIGSGVGGGDGIFVKNTDNAVIKKNTIKNAHINAGLRKGSGILVVQSDGAQIGDVGEGNIIDNSGSDGIVIRTDGGSNDLNKIVGNTITGALDSRTGIYTENATNTTIDQNTVSGSGRYAAIYGYGGSGFKITKNILNHNDEMGILVQSAGGVNLIDDNKIDNTGEDVKNSDGTNVGNAIHVTNTSGLTISNNKIGQNGGNIQGDGVYVSGSNGVTIKSNKISDTRTKTLDANGANGSGIQVVETTGVTIGGPLLADGNIIKNAQWDGIRLQNNGTVTARYNDIDVTGRVGIWGGNITTAFIQDNKVQHDGLAGYGSIHADGGSSWIVARNDVDYGDYGIFLNGVGGAANMVGGTVTADGNKVDNVTADGIRIVNTTGLTVGHNKVGANGGNVGGNGVFVDPSNVAQLFDNTILNVGGNGIWSLNNNDASIYHNTITGAGLDGILVQGGNNVTIGGTTVAKANTIKNSGDDGIDVEGTTGTVLVRFNTVDTTGLNAAPNEDQNGIEVSGTTGATIQDNIVKKAAWDGINLQQSGGATIKDNQIFDTLGASGIGAYNGISNTLIDGNVITKALQFGMWLGSGSTGTLTVTNNDISGITNSDGIYVNGNTGTILINNNDIYNVGRDGISANGDIDEVNNNRVLKTGANGILVLNSPYVDIKSNKVGVTISGANAAARLRTTNGTSISSVSSQSASANNIGGDGIHVEDSNYAEIISNTVSNTADDGIFLDPSDYSVIASNTINNVGGDGIESADNSYVTIGGLTTADGNTISGAGAHGINLHGGVSALIQNNTVKGGNATLSGFTLTNGVSGAKLDGIHVENNKDVQILANTIAAGQGLTYTIPAWVPIIGGTTIGANGGNGADNHGIFVAQSNNAVIDQNFVNPDILGSGLGAGVDGIHVENSNNLTVGGLVPVMNGNKILSTGRDGIYVDGSTGAFILNNIISNAGFGGFSVGEIGDDGIDMQNTLGTLVAGNIIAGVKDDGIEFSNGALSAIGLNFILNAGGNGINISNSDLLLVGLNQIDGTGAHGIALNDVNLSLIGWNTISNTDGDGIHSRLSLLQWITNNDISGAGDDGIDAAWVAGVAITDNTIDNVDDDGIRLFGALGALVTGNTITNADDDGIDVALGALLDVSDNTIDNVGDNGIEASFIGFSDIDDNDIGLTGNVGGNGIDLRNSIFVGIAANDIGTNVQGNGIYVDPSFFITVDNNDINGVGQDGIRADDTFFLTVSNNRVNNSGDDGIELGGWLGVHDAELLKNVVTGSAVNGLYVSGQNNGSVVLKGNAFTDNPTGARFESGLIDLTGLGADRNTFTNGDKGMVFDPTAKGNPNNLVLVGDTIGETEFVNQSTYYVELANGAFFAPGTPTILDGYHATYDGFRPDTVPFLTALQYNAIESKIYHFVDENTLGLFFFGNQQANINDEDAYNTFAGFAGPGSQFRITILGLPRTGAQGGQGGGQQGGFAGNIADFLANIAPAAGGNGSGKKKAQQISTAEQLADLEPAAGGTGNAEDASCWSQAVAAASGGAPVSYSFGSSMEQALTQTADCGTGI